MKTITNCADCPRHMVVPDPDKYDSFCDDDVAVLCAESPNVHNQRSWKRGKVFPHRPVAVSVRPHRVRLECEAPAWCPLGGGKR